MSSNFRYQPFVAVSRNLRGKVPVVDDVLSSHEQQIFPTTSLHGSRIGFEFQTDLNYLKWFETHLFGFEIEIRQVSHLRNLQYQIGKRSTKSGKNA